MGREERAVLSVAVNLGSLFYFSRTPEEVTEFQALENRGLWA